MPHKQREFKKLLMNEIWLINDLGQYELLSDDLSKEENYTADQTEEITELSAVVNYISRVSKTVPLNLPDKPWLEPLETAIISPQTDIHWTDEKVLAVPFARMDIPTEQRQKDYHLIWKKWGIQFSMVHLVLGNP